MTILSKLSAELAALPALDGIVRALGEGPARFPVAPAPAAARAPLVAALALRHPGPLLFLASKASDFYTGHILYADGGYTAG